MKIYFEDGKLFKDRPGIPYGHSIIEIDAKNGYTHCENILKKNHMKNIIVYTNSVNALMNGYAWNSEFKIHEIYIRNNDRKFERIDKLTNIKLEFDSNIFNMYINGIFNDR